MTWYESDEHFFRNEQAAIAAKYPELRYRSSNGKMQLEGLLRFSASFENKPIHDEYSILISFPEDYPAVYPVVEETGGRIAADYHKNPGGALCMTTHVQALMIFRQNPTIVGFVENLLIPYLYRHSYVEKHGASPFPDFAHGAPGLIESYSEYFSTPDIMVIGELLYLFVTDRYRGHTLCPCNSGRKLRNCHGARLLALPKEAVRYEFLLILDYLKKKSHKEREN